MAPPWCRVLGSGLTVVLLACVFGACQGPDATRLIRLVDRVDSSVIAESPLLAPVPTHEVATKTVWRSDFEGEIFRELGWPEKGEIGAWVETDPTYGQVVCFSGHRAEQFSILIPAEPLVRYRVRRVLETNWVDLDLRVVESSIRLPRGESLKDRQLRRREISDRVLTKTSALAAHRFGGEGNAAWAEAELGFTSNLDTKTLGIVFERIGGTSRPLQARSCLAGLIVERLDPNPAQEIALLREAWVEGRDHGLGVVKRGHLLPLRRARQSRPPYDGNYEVRDALFAPAPTRLRFPLTLPDAPRMTFSYSLSAGSQLGDQVEFEVVVERRGRQERVFVEELEIGPRGEGWHWHDAALDLAPWAGQEVVLELRTRSTTPRGLGLWANPMIDSPRRRGDPPNVILIGIDTLRADRLSSYGYERQTSPHLDRLASEGLRFDQAISASNWTSPSFGSIFTGLAASSHGVVNQEFAMNDDVETLAQALRDGGWRTHAVVYKAALYGLGLDRGFDRWFNMPSSWRIAQTNLDKALAFLDTTDDRRFFLFFHLDDPHQPFNQPAPFDFEFGDSTAPERFGFELPLSIRNGGINGCGKCVVGGKPEEEFVRVAQDLYDGAIAYTDDRIGALVASLKERGIYDDTVIAVVSDHGEVIYDRHGLWGHGALLLADELVRVPLIIKPASRVSRPGQVVESQVRTTDLLPTLLEAVGLPPASRPDSRSLWPLVEGSEGGDRVAYIENPQRGVVGLRTTDWKYAVRTRRNRSVGLLYDLEADPGELVNLAWTLPTEVARLDELLASFILRTRGGAFLLVIGDGRPGAFQLVLERSGDTGERSLLGLPALSAARPDDLEVAGGGRVLALVQLDLPPGETVQASLISGGRTLESVEASSEDLTLYDPETWARLLASPGAYVLRGPAQVGATRIGPPTQVDQVEDLRALGYIN